ncbi:MAG TPA: hypothetical protein VFO31_11320, partial [Vicinamibacterales bacterium]|nr:hypothetical protein [Vicinamibacterales bacterium]
MQQPVVGQHGGGGVPDQHARRPWHVDVARRGGSDGARDRVRGPFVQSPQGPRRQRHGVLDVNAAVTRVAARLCEDPGCRRAVDDDAMVV